MAKKKQFVTAAAAFAVAASAVAPAITADAASTTVQLSSDYVRGGDLDAALDKEYKGSEIYWYKSSVDMNKLGVFQTAKGFVKGKGIRVEKKLRVLNHAQDIQPEEIVLEEGVPASGLRIQPVLFADGVKYNKVVTYAGFSTEKAGEFEGTFTYSNKAFGVVTKTVKYKVVASKVELSEVKSEVMDDVLSVTADVKNLKDGEKVELVVYANRDMNAALPAVQAEVKDGKLTVKSDKLPAGNHSFILRSGEVKTDVINFVVEAPMVKEVKAINAKQLQVTFNKAIDASVIDANGSIVDNAFTLAKVSGPAAGVGVIGNGSAAKLSEDKMSVIIDASARLEGQYVLTLAEDKVNTTAGKAVPAYTSSVFGVEDKVAPAVASVSNLSASVVRVKFTEPLSSLGSWTFKLANGSNATVTPDPGFTAGDDYIDLTIDSSVANGSQITATILGAADYANNLITPNPTTINFTKGSLDGVAPTVTSVTPNGLNKFELKFSEEVQGLTVADILVDGVARTANDATLALTGTEAIITQDSTDKTKYLVEVAPFASAGIHSIGLVVNAVTDLSGETSAAFSKVVEFKADTVAPKLVKSEVKTESGIEYLYLTFDESVTEGSVSALTATEVKNYVTVNGTIDLSNLAPVAGTDSKQHKVALSDIDFDPNGPATASEISNSATYTVALTGFSDASGNPLASTSISFTRAADTDLTKPNVVLTDGDTATNVIVNNGVTVVDNDTLQITFDKALDGASATNKSNYTVNGLAVKSATLLPNNVVELKLAENTNSLTGMRNVAISGVKSASGVLMNPFTASEYFVENVRPTFTAALTQNNEITLTFSENVENLTGDVAADFVVNIDGVDVTTFSPAVSVTENGTDGTKSYTLALSRALTATEYAKTITVTPASGIDVQDTNDNRLSFTSVNVSK